MKKLPKENYEFYTQQGNLLIWKPLFCVPYYTVQLDLSEQDIESMIDEIYTIQEEKKFTKPDSWSCNVITSYESKTTFPPHTKIYEIFKENA